MEKKLLTIKEASERYSIKPAILRNLCHARGQRFAFQLVRNGMIRIDPEKFEKWYKFYYA